MINTISLNQWISEYASYLRNPESYSYSTKELLWQVKREYPEIHYKAIELNKGHREVKSG